MASLEPGRPFNEARGYIDPVYESLKLRAEAAERAVQATKHHLNCMSLRRKIAALELKKAKLEEEKARLIERGKFYVAQANNRKRVLGNSETLADHLAHEVNRKQDKAAQLKKKWAGCNVKMSRLETKIKGFEEQAKREEELKDENMEMCKQLEIQAMNYDKS
ncbi:MAG: hypothetical protein ACE5IJ_08735 [Thermoplasmata archaeon]